MALNSSMASRLNCCGGFMSSTLLAHHCRTKGGYLAKSGKWDFLPTLTNIDKYVLVSPITAWLAGPMFSRTCQFWQVCPPMTNLAARLFFGSELAMGSEILPCHRYQTIYDLSVNNPHIHKRRWLFCWV